MGGEDTDMSPVIFVSLHPTSVQRVVLPPSFWYEGEWINPKVCVAFSKLLTHQDCALDPHKEGH